MIVELFTKSGGYVATVEILPFVETPDVLVWGERIFTRRDASSFVEAFSVFSATPSPGLPRVVPPPPPEVDRSAVVTLHGTPVDELRAQQAAQPVGMHADYIVLSDEERARGFVRPVRSAYRHLKCGTVTSMGIRLAETYARDPGFYGATFCCACNGHHPVGAAGEFVWDDGSDTKVGT